MSYASQQNLTDRFGNDELLQLTDRATPPTGTIDATVVAEALADADAIIDSYIGKRYDLPLASTPIRLIAVGCDLARYSLYKDDPTETVAARHTDAIKWLRDISTGAAVLDVAGSPPAAAGDQVRISAPARTFTKTTLGGF